MRIALACLLAGWWAVATAAYLPVWDAPPLLAQHQAQMAPRKPRALVNYGTMLILQQQFAEARAVLTTAAVMADLPYVPAYDRQRAQDAVRTNLRGLAALEARSGGTIRLGATSWHTFPSP